MSYGRYLKIDELLSLQAHQSDGPEHDETLFIIIHQVYELWFKQVLHELDQFVEHANADMPFRGGHQLKRVLKILKTLVAQLDVLETMTPLEFVSFRSFLDNSSGFQSAQFRELEFLLGQKSLDHVERFEADSTERIRLQERYESPTLWDAFVGHLSRSGADIPQEFLDRDVTSTTSESSGIQAALVKIYQQDPALAALCESLTDLDEGLQEWRYRHVMMVQRTIGTKMGTGGSSGAEYLRSTLFRPVFPDLWAIRAQF